MRDTICEYAVIGLDIARRRWHLLVLPIVAAVCLAFVAVKIAPTTYEARSLILLEPANRGGGLSATPGYARQNVIEQVAAVEAWLKSDQVMRSLVQRLFAPEDIATQSELAVHVKILRARLTLELVGGSALEVRLEGPEPAGLAQKLEIIVARLMEGLTGPEQSILNAVEFVQEVRRDDAAATQAALVRVMTVAGISDRDAAVARLERLVEIERRLAIVNAGGRPGDLGAAELVRQGETVRKEFGVDRATLDRLEGAFSDYLVARARAEKPLDRSNRSSNYVGIFDAPENLLLVGRPQDPLVGTSSARKLALLGILLSVLVGFGLVIAAEVLAGRLMTRSDYEVVAGLPVIARFSSLE